MVSNRSVARCHEWATKSSPSRPSSSISSDSLWTTKSSRGITSTWTTHSVADAILVNRRRKLLGLVCDNAGPLAKTSLRQSASSSRRWRSFNGPINDRGRARPKPKTLGRRKASLLASCAGTALAHALHRHRSLRGMLGFKPRHTGLGCA